uniref:Uncharacterized protein n=1 Tax=Anguilla anguilla TaxID=7936 RepID=A0A0E9Q9C2_ANGAN
MIKNKIYNILALPSITALDKIPNSLKQENKYFRSNQ